jgi:hypothetical protein
MLSTLKGHLSANLLAGQSNHTVSKARLHVALTLALLIALLSALFAFAQWRVGENLASLYQQKALGIEKSVATTANMATQQANAHRATLNVLLSRDEAEVKEAESLRRSNVQGYLESSRTLESKAPWSEAVQDLQTLTLQYDQLSAQVVGLFRRGRLEDALDLRVSSLREAFDKWQQAHAAFGAKTAQADAEQRKYYAEATAQTRRWLIAFLVAPLALITIGIFAIAGLLGLQRLDGNDHDPWSH